MIRDVVLGIKLVRLNHQEFASKHGVELLHVCEAALSRLQSEDFLVVDDQNIALTDKGVIYGDYVGRVLEGAMRGFGGSRSGDRTRVLM